MVLKRIGQFGMYCLVMVLYLTVSVASKAEVWSDEELTQAATAAGCTYLTQEEKDIFTYSNLARLYPAKFARIELANEGDDWCVTSLRNELNSRSAVQALCPDYNTYLYAKCFATEQSQTGAIGHDRHTCEKMSGWWAENCSYGERSAERIVVDLLIDKRTSSLGHRKNLLNGIYNAYGVSINSHPEYGKCVVMDFQKLDKAPEAKRVQQVREQQTPHKTPSLSPGYGSPDKSYNPMSIRLSAEEIELYELAMAYRAEHGLPSIPLSPALTYVAQTHAKDVYAYYYEIPEGCNPHTWSSHGSWTRCDYYPDHRNKECVWSKPSELTTYTGNGYEIIAYYTPPSSANFTASEALNCWKNSAPHNAQLLNLNNWSKHPYKAIGIGIYKGVACIWFGERSDEYTINL